MCLDYTLSKKKASKIIEQAKKRGYIRLFKVCYYKRTGWMFGLKWKKGIRKASHLEEKDVGWNVGWYAFLTKEAAIKYLDSSFVKTCYAKPQWIKRLGAYSGYGKAGIFTHLAFPDWDKGDMTIREFRQMCKEFES